MNTGCCHPRYAPKHIVFSLKTPLNYLMPGYCLEMIFRNSEVNLGIKTAKIFCRYNSVLQFKKELLLIYCRRCKAHRFHSLVEPLCTLVCLSEFRDALTLMWNALRFSITQRNDNE